MFVTSTLTRWGFFIALRCRPCSAWSKRKPPFAERVLLFYNVSNISNKTILELEVPIPGMEVQKKFEALIKQSDKSKLKKERKKNE